MKRIIPLLFLIIMSSGTSIAQESWILLQEYPSPANYALGLFYDGKLLWHVDWDSAMDIHTVYTLNPYNCQIVDIYPSPVTQPWGITNDGHNFWMTSHGLVGQAQSKLVKILPDTFAVDTSWNFNGYYFYGISYDSVGGHLWVAAQTPQWVKYIMEFDPVTCQVIAWHPWPYIWALGIQYWDGRLWINTYDYNYPDHTYIIDFNPWQQVENIYVPPYACPEGIATNGLVWWISYWRWGHHCIQKLIPPGWGFHDIAAYLPVSPPGSGTIQELTLSPEARFINYGTFTEGDVPFECRIREDSGGGDIYYDHVVYPDSIIPEEVVSVVFDQVTLQANTDYTFLFYSQLPIDEYRSNDTLRLHVHTANVVNPIHDLAILSVLSPESTMPLAPITPTIIVQNQGNVPEPVAPVSLSILNPDQSTLELNTQATQLAVLEIDTLFFPTFTPPESAEYRFTFDGLLPEDCNPSNDLVVMNCTFGVVHDIAPIEIISPPFFSPLAPITPRALVANLGDFDEPAFYSICAISDSIGEFYRHQVICPQINIGEQYEIMFPTVVPAYPGAYTFTFRTLLSTDQVPENDSIMSNTLVGLLHDISPTQVLEPGSIINTASFQPTVVVTNLGTEPSEYCHAYCIVDTAGYEVFTMISNVQPLEPAVTDTVRFLTIALPSPNTYRFRFITAWQADNIPENDTLAFWTEYPEGVGGLPKQIVTEFYVENSYPNPFNSQTTFTIHLPASASVTLELFRLDGSKAISRQFGSYPAGVHQLSLDFQNQASGVYIARIKAGKWEQSIKIALLK
ncbi:MAG: T9SS type A sorting domain-containing protein [bacterium]|nr:T9SS type A sorting domain-containing protein [bacterium]